MPRIDLQKLLLTRRGRFKKPAVLIMTFALILLGVEKMPMLAEPTVGEAMVVDGDTLDLHGQRIRLFGIDAPESQQACKKEGKTYSCGTDASHALATIIGQQNVTCEKQDKDSYQRIVAICYAGATELNRWMVANGHALAYKQYTDRYVADEASAKAAGLGLWAGSFQKPWDFRHHK